MFRRSYRYIQLATCKLDFLLYDEKYIKNLTFKKKRVYSRQFFIFFRIYMAQFDIDRTANEQLDGSKQQQSKAQMLTDIQHYAA